VLYTTRCYLGVFVKGESVVGGDSIYDQVLSGDWDIRDRVLVYGMMLPGVSAEIHFHRRMSFHGPNSTLTQFHRDFREKVLAHDMMLSGVSDRM